MDAQSACKRLVEVEQAYNILECKDRDYFLWPMIRVPLWFLLTTRPRSNVKVFFRLTAYALKVISSSLLFGRSVEVDNVKREQILLLADHLYYTEQFEGGEYHRLMDPVMDSIGDNYACTKLNVFKQRGRMFAREGVEIELQQTDFRSHWRAIRELRQLLPVLKKIADTAKVSIFALVDEFLRHYSRSLYSSSFYQKIFEQCKPKLVVMACWYRRENMGVCHAARKCGIPSVDLQHGKQGRFHGAYNHWTKLPQDGYDTVPTQFWMWGSESAANMMNGSHRRWANEVKVVGNSWVNIYKTDERFDQITDYYVNELVSRKTILISLQSNTVVPEGAIPEYLIDAIERSPKEWLWVFRLHPNHLYVLSEVKEKLERVHAKRYLLDGIEKLSLYSLLKRADHHITAFSSVLYEAELFGVKSSLYGKDALSLYSEEIKSDRFMYFNNADGLLEQINSCSSSRTYNASPYIETNPNLLLQTTASLLEGICDVD